MKSKTVAFLLLFGLIAPSAVMSVESWNAVTEDTDGGNVKKRTALKEKASNLLTKYSTQDTPHAPKEPRGICSKEDVFLLTINNVLKLLDDIEHKHFENEIASVINQYFHAFATYQPDSLDEDGSLNRVLTSDPIKILLKSQAIQNAGKKAFEGFPEGGTLLQVLAAKTKKYQFIEDIYSIRNPFNESSDLFDEGVANDNEKINDLIKKMRLSIADVKGLIDFAPTFEKLKEKYDQIKRLYSDPSDSTIVHSDDDETFNNDLTPSDIVKAKDKFVKAKEKSDIDKAFYKEYYELFDEEIKKAKDKIWNETEKKEEEYLCTTYPELKGFFKHRKLMNQIDEQHEKFINYLDYVSDADSKESRLTQEESRLTQEKTLVTIDRILSYIDNNRV